MGSPSDIHTVNSTPLAEEQTRSNGDMETPKDGSSASSISGYLSTLSRAQIPPSSSRLSPNGTITPVTSLPTEVTTAGTSKRNSFTSTRSFGSHAPVGNIKHELMVNHLFQEQCKKLWVGDIGNGTEGVVIRQARGSYMACPPNLAHSPFAYYCSIMNFQVAMTVNSRVIQAYLHWNPGATNVPVGNSLRVQVLPSMTDLPKARKNQFAAFIAESTLLVVWDDEPLNICKRAVAIEEEIMKLVWRTGEDTEVEEGNKEKGPTTEEIEIDDESREVKSEHRPTNLFNSILVGITLLLVEIMLGAGLRVVVIESKIDSDYKRLVFVAIWPLQIFLTLFFTQVVVGSFAQIFGPTRQMKTNSRYYSARCSRRLAGQLPHITIQCPVYKEGLASVIALTIKSIKQAITTYELQGGSANMFINDDGLQLVGKEERCARIEFYADHGIGWTARPPHGSDGFVRKGKFKKASNMNYGLMLSNSVETKLVEVQRGENWNQNDEAREYERCLNEVLRENGRAWADGNIRVGDYILLVDSDTRVPADCLLDAVSEMELSPEVGILQFSSGVMQVTKDYFENGITFFTNLIYTAIEYCVANGDVAPFVGHNAILRWSAIQQVSFYENDEGKDTYEKYWSESHVSEDFDMSLRLQVDGYIVRLAAWADHGFKEGVSLTVYDELARWEKYAYGCSELIFHPLRLWITRGPFTPLFKKFLFSGIKLTSKITILAYIGTYYAIGAACVMTLANYFVIGWFNGYLDKYYMDSWKVWFSIIIVFNGLGNIALAMLRYRIGTNTFVGALIENFKWTFMLAIFLGGLSLHISQAILSHMFSINMMWGATSKEAEYSNFFIEIPRVLKRFKYSMTFAVIALIGMIILATAPFIPYDWGITDFVAILPLATVAASHLLLPIILNPALMTFSW